MKTTLKTRFASAVISGGALLIVSLFWPMVAMGQVSSSSGNSGQGSSSSADDNAARPQHMSDSLPDPTNIQTGNVLPSGNSPLHWGKLSVVSFSVLDAYSADLRSPVTGSLDDSNSVGFNALLSYDVREAGFNFNLQYQPMLYVTDGNLTSELSNQRLNLTTARKIGLWVLQFTDNFYYLPANGQAAFGMANGNWVDGAGQNPNLVNGQNTLGNSFGVSTQRLLGPRDDLSFGGTYQYYRINGIPLSTTDPSLGRTQSTQETATANIGWTHKLGWKSTVGLSYDFAHNNVSQQDGSIETVGDYNTITASYTYQPTQTVKIAVGGGPAWLGRPGPNGSNGKALLSSQGYVSVTKTMRRSAITLLYGRNDTFNGIISNSMSEYVSLSGARSLSRKVSVSAGGGYARQVATSNGEHGWHGYAQANYGISRRWSMFGGFSFLSQTGAQSYYSNTIPKYISAGLTWSWGQSEDHN